MKSTKTTIDGIEVQIIKFNPLKGGTILGTTMKMFAPSIKKITKAAEEKLSDEQQVEILVEAVQDLFAENTPEQVMAYLADLITTGYIIVKDKKITSLDDLEAFVGEDGDALYLMSMIAAESIKYNFSKFLGKLMPGQTFSSEEKKA